VSLSVAATRLVALILCVVLWHAGAYTHIPLYIRNSLRLLIKAKHEPQIANLHRQCGDIFASSHLWYGHGISLLGIRNC